MTPGAGAGGDRNQDWRVELRWREEVWYWEGRHGVCFEGAWGGNPRALYIPSAVLWDSVMPDWLTGRYEEVRRRLETGGQETVEETPRYRWKTYYGLPRRRSEASLEDPLFAYGTLQFPEVLDVLLGRVPEMRAEIVAGYRVARLRDRVYPALVPVAGGQAAGVLLPDLTEYEWDVVDAFEDDAYQLEVLLLGDRRVASGYVAGAAMDVLAADWDPQEFRSTELSGYVARCGGWVTKEADR